MTRCNLQGKLSKLNIVKELDLIRWVHENFSQIPRNCNDFTTSITRVLAQCLNTVSIRVFPLSPDSLEMSVIEHSTNIHTMQLARQHNYVHNTIIHRAQLSTERICPFNTIIHITQLSIQHNCPYNNISHTTQLFT
jgi:hypothetical protein